MNCIIAPSLLESDYKHLADQLEMMEKAGIKYIHLDVMDGHFVPNLSFGMKLISSIRSVTDMIFDVHLMVENPDWLIEPMVEAGADVITIHYEASDNIEKVLNHIKACGVRSGIVLKPNTPVNVLNERLISNSDVVQLMSVEPGLPGQIFIPETYKRIREVKTLLNYYQCKADIEVDGNITLDNVEQVTEAGATIVVVGRAMFQMDMQECVTEMKRRMKFT